MTGQLQSVGGDGPIARCITCGKKAVGPCARCHDPVCGDCCVLTEGGSKTFAICFACEDGGGRSLTRGWWTVLLWIALPILVLAALVALLAMAQSR